MPTETTPSWLDKKFLENALGKEIVSFKVRPIGKKNENFASYVFGVEVKLRSKEKEHLFVKKMMDKGGEESLPNIAMFEREIHMYSVVIPKLSAILEKAIPGCEPIAPRLVFSSSGVLVLEDLSASGYRIVDSSIGLDLHQGLLVMRALARFQAASMILNKQEPECFQLYDKHVWADPAMARGVGNYFTSMMLLLADEILNWPGFGERYAKMIREISGKVLQLAADAVKRREDRFNVLSHSDLWVNNILLRSPDNVRLIDFQMPHYSAIGIDLQCFIVSSLTDEVRRNHSDTLLKEYFDIFSDALTAMGYEGKMLTFQDLQEEFRRSSDFCSVVSLAFLPLLYVTPEMEIALFDSEGTPTSKNLYADGRVKEKIMEIIRYYEKMGAYNFES